MTRTPNTRLPERQATAGQEPGQSPRPNRRSDLEGGRGRCRFQLWGRKQDFGCGRAHGSPGGPRWTPILIVALALATGLAGEVAAQAVCRARLPAEHWTALVQCELEEGKDYDIALVASRVPADEHRWKAAVTVALREGDHGEVYAVASGGREKYLERETNGNGRTYWSHLLIDRITEARGGKYILTLVESTVSDPFPGVLQVVVTERHSGESDLEPSETDWFWWTCWEVLKGQSFVLSLILASVMSGLTAMFSGSASKDGGFWGGGCGGGCGGCGGCGG